MELSDIKTKQALSEQLERYSIIADQLADNIQDLGKLAIASDKTKDIETAKAMIYRASRALSMVAEGLKGEN
ncbi:hypothetical protein BHL85_11030 [Limosilactobacillus reuteri]|uniref:hypothetical protein n=1 Tax=Limosilactobacillus reuteri TaxID=1598 RepID=UPI000A2D993B|nr:hypothetical protein [Limosilactobacillus reuteri]OTA45864.1 hypothetical protein BHL74_05060 [Limosilactobacillus reuteri]OTA52617.1 hypothetical protein BHL85_11030 [Limosilactobacillus reuteri]